MKHHYLSFTKKFNIIGRARKDHTAEIFYKNLPILPMSIMPCASLNSNLSPNSSRDFLLKSMDLDLAGEALATSPRTRRMHSTVMVFIID